MKRAKGLFDRIAAFRPLCEAARRAARGRRNKSASPFLLDLEPQVLALERELRSGEYAPRPYRTFAIRDPKPRRISAPTFRDRVVHHAVCAAIEPVLERHSIDDSYACRRGRGVHAAIRRAQTFARCDAWYVKLDVEHFFETADHDVIRSLLRRRFAEPRLLSLLDQILDCGPAGAPPGKGLPIGALTSQHLANHLLGRVDHFVKHDLRVRGYLRYMDDMLLFGPEGPTVRRYAKEVEAVVRDELRLKLRSDAERLAPVAVGVPFLGFRVWPGVIRLDAARVRRLRRRLRSIERAVRCSRLTEEDAARRAESLVGWTLASDSWHLRADLVARMIRDGAARGLGEES